MVFKSILNIYFFSMTIIFKIDFNSFKKKSQAQASSFIKDIFVANVSLLILWSVSDSHFIEHLQRTAFGFYRMSNKF